MLSLTRIFAIVAVCSLPHLYAGVFPDARENAPKEWKGNVFVLSQNYPTVPPATPPPPWNGIDFRTDWKRYVKTVFAYVREGNVEVDWKVQDNKIRKWYHAPWQHYGRAGREPIHGLTHERVSLSSELHPLQTSMFQNWAVGFYNDVGGYTIGQVWRDPNNPNPKAAHFPEGTVAAKLLFTQASPDQVPYLKGAKEWDAYIYQDIFFPTNPRAKRTIQKLRLLQIDLAVKDKNSPGGWVFATLVYNGDLRGDEVWDKFEPVGLMWGNDPKVTVVDGRHGTTLRETLSYSATDVPYQHLGYGGRLSGPVDNPLSSCLSCHSTAQWPSYSPAVPNSGISPDSSAWMKWFRNLKPGETFDSATDATSLDFSLQLNVGLANFYEWIETLATKGGVETKSTGSQAAPAFLNVTDVQKYLKVYNPSRDAGEE